MKPAAIRDILPMFATNVEVAVDPEANLRDELEKLKEMNKRLEKELEDVRDLAMKINLRKKNIYE